MARTKTHVLLLSGLVAAGWLGQPVLAQDSTPAPVTDIKTDPEAASSAARIIAPPVATPDAATTAAAPAATRPTAGSGRGDVKPEAVDKAAEIMKSLGLVRPPADRMRDAGESEETTPTQLFNEAEVRRLLSKEPTVVYQVVYQGTPLPDPMIVPWIRNRQVLQERYDKAIDALAQGKMTEAREALSSIIADFPEADQAKQAAEILAKLEKMTGPPTDAIAAILTPSAGPEVIIQLDPNVKVSAVVVDSNDPNNNLAMVSGRTYRVGEAIRGFPNHTVVKIENSAVDIEVEARGQSKQFRVPVLARSGAN